MGKNVTYLPTFEVDKEGLRRVLSRRGLSWIIPELVQNAWDEQVTTVTIDASFTPDGKSGVMLLSVEDDDPDGFTNLAHAYTLYADSEKKTNAQLRGRFNLGDKMVVAACSEAAIYTTTGTVRFNEKGRTVEASERDKGSRFLGTVPMTRDEYDDALTVAHSLICPAGVTTTLNGEPLPTRVPRRSWREKLHTEIGEELRRTERVADVTIYEPLPGETPMLYELGNPVVATGDRWHVDIGQKVPLNTERDNVPPAYLRDVRRSVLNHCADLLTGDDSSATWTNDAAEDADIEPEALKVLLDKRFGEKRVSYDPTDPEANKIAVSEGYTVVHSRMLPKKAWAHARENTLIRPAGQVTPSPKPYDPGVGKTRAELPREKWTVGMVRHEALVKLLCRECFDVDVDVSIVNDPQCRNFSATYCRGNPAAFEFNLQTLGRLWFESSPLTESHLSLAIHELGHQLESDHLSRGYYNALTTIGARVTMLALRDPAALVAVEVLDLIPV